jgi:cysteine sulfinate desulfinase/cysteine desulfurase-like protein
MSPARFTTLPRALALAFATPAGPHRHQMVGKVPLNVDEASIDLMSISGHKIYGPKGVGALYIRRKPRVRLEPLISGGGQERGLRSGTLPHPLIVGLGAACAIAQEDMAVDRAWVERLSKRLYEGITSKVSHVRRGRGYRAGGRMVVTCCALGVPHCRCRPPRLPPSSPPLPAGDPQR